MSIKQVDLANSHVCGDLMIKGLTETYPTLTTFFEAEVIGDRHSFLTRKWDATAEVDHAHWRRFPAFEPIEGEYRRPGFVYDFGSSDHIFMRWKEYFLVPNYKVQKDNENLDGV